MRMPSPARRGLAPKGVPALLRSRIAKRLAHDSSARRPKLEEKSRGGAEPREHDARRVPVE